MKGKNQSKKIVKNNIKKSEKILKKYNTLINISDIYK